MQIKILLPIVLVIIVVTESVFIGNFIFNVNPPYYWFYVSPILSMSGPTEFIPHAADGVSKNVEFPTLLTIPVINVNAPITYVGITPGGTMDVPKNPTDVAWFNLGPSPGMVGSAVMAGHFGWKNGLPAVFDNLYKLQKGDKLYVKNENGSSLTFVVRELRTFGEGQDAATIFTSNDGKAHLNLITCQGVWNKDKKSYSERLVVFTDRETE